MRPPAAPERPGTPSSTGEQDADPGPGPGPGGPGGPGGTAAWEEDEAGPPALVIYVVEPPAAHAHRPRALAALLRLASQVANHLHHHNPLVKVHKKFLQTLFQENGVINNQSMFISCP